MIGVIIARPADPGAWSIDTWLMSCRVLGRRVEEAMLAELASAARQRGIASLRAHYLPRERNAMVAEHFDRLGFTRIAEQADGAREYLLDLAAYAAPVLPFVDTAEVA